MIKQSKNIFFALIAFLVVVILYWFFTVLIVDSGERSKIKKGMMEAEQNFDRLRNERANYESVKNNREMQIQYFDTLKTHIPLKDNTKGENSYIETLDIIQQIAENNNVKIDVFRPILVDTFPQIDVASKQLDKNIERYLVEMECNGNFISIGSFFNELIEHDRIVNLLKFNIETEYGSMGNLFCEAILYTYVFAENN